MHDYKMGSAEGSLPPRRLGNIDFFKNAANI